MGVGVPRSLGISNSFREILGADSSGYSEIDRFWSSCKNKEMLQSAAATSFIEKAKMANFTTVLSRTITGDNDSRNAKIVMNKEVQICSDLRTFVEEADGRIVMHLFHAVQSGDITLYYSGCISNSSKALNVEV
ncbi:hypothetical protein JTE90_007955 [Oedothorax gibbosus]|uniref:Uncharacterized protein n=1 Tax=Oedothorax gibbosus TaxID=931172 RepID=A0AAV6U7D8_9ARAC|nr:hypothetical protein JTE90_007955 [Oedothorax gibbosus]